jgi:hypothetical protein
MAQRRFALITFCALLAACTPHPSAQTQQQQQQQAASTSPSVQATPIVVAYNAPPQIVAVQLTSPVFHSGDTVSGSVVTTTNVSTVNLELAGRVMSLPKIEDGRFGMTYHVPSIPFFLKHQYTVHVVAKTATGAEATRDVTVWLQ